MSEYEVVHVVVFEVEYVFEVVFVFEHVFVIEVVFVIEHEAEVEAVGFTFNARPPGRGTGVYGTASLLIRSPSCVRVPR